MVLAGGLRSTPSCFILTLRYLPFQGKNCPTSSLRMSALIQHGEGALLKILQYFLDFLGTPYHVKVNSSLDKTFTHQFLCNITFPYLFGLPADVEGIRIVASCKLLSILDAHCISCGYPLRCGQNSLFFCPYMPPASKISTQ